jgi:hypothetical protein
MADMSPTQCASGTRAANLNVVHRNGPGEYEVKFPGISVGTGTAIVTAAGVGGSHCTIGKQTINSVQVYCFDPFGTLADERFALNFSSAWPNLATSYAYAHADNPLAASYFPAIQNNVRCYSWFGQPIDTAYNALYTTL